jgi:hypothetical protein
VQWCTCRCSSTSSLLRTLDTDWCPVVGRTCRRVVRSSCHRRRCNNVWGACQRIRRTTYCTTAAVVTATTAAMSGGACQCITDVNTELHKSLSTRIRAHNSHLRLRRKVTQQYTAASRTRWDEVESSHQSPFFSMLCPELPEFSTTYLRCACACAVAAFSSVWSVHGGGSVSNVRVRV